MNLKRKFFKRSADEVAKKLLGKRLVRKFPDGSRKEGIITETEAYMGECDLASHASKGRTRRTEVMYQKAGIVYVYLIYGIYWMLNFVTSDIDDPQAVLIRSLDKVSGPGKLTGYLEIDKKLNKVDLVKSDRIWVEDTDKKVKNKDIKVSRRIGVDYAKKWKDKPLRFTLK